MKIKRYKKAEKFMSLYKNNFGFREPYQVLLDGTFCQVALTHKVNIQEQLPRYLKGQCKLLTTRCVIDETKRLGKPLHGAYVIISQFGIHNCGHEKPISASRCLSSFIIESKNKDHYILATQDHQLREKIAKEVVCPLVKLANNALVLEKPPPKIEGKVKRTHHFLANKLKDEEREKLAILKSKEKILDETVNIKKKKKKRGPKGPNPLSCKKKKPKTKKSN
jgi:U3 small nucleolar RNA-associated protein 23